MNHLFQAAGGLSLTVLFHPPVYAKTLIQIGYEPVGPDPTTTIFGGKKLIYPNIFKYMRHIKRTDGWMGLYRGLGSRLVASFVCNHVTLTINSMTGADNCACLTGDPMEQALQLAHQLSLQTISRCAGIIVSHPFHVIFVRCAAQFVGRESKYCSIWSSMSEIWDKDGWQGFFSGLVPRILGELLTLWLATAIAHCLNTYVLTTQQPAIAKEMRGYTFMFSELMVTQFTYPFTVVSTVMCANNCGLAAGQPPISPIYNGWRDCWSRLKAEGEYKRGSGAFFRYYCGKTVLNSYGVLQPVRKSQ